MADRNGDGGAPDRTVPHDEAGWVMRLTHIRIKNFRAIREVDLELPPFAVLVGPNGAGKSSFLDVIRSMDELIRANYPAAFSRHGSFASNICYCSQADSIDVGLGLASEGTKFSYDLGLAKEGNAYFVRKEVVVGEGTAGQQISVQRDDRVVTAVERRGDATTESVNAMPHGPDTCLLRARFARLFSNSGLDVRDFLEAVSSWLPSSFQPNTSARQPQQLQPARVPDQHGGNLFSVLYSLELDRPSLFEELCDLLRAAIPTFHSMEFPISGPGYVNMRWRQTDLREELWPTQLSDGTIRLLWLLAILLTAPDDGIVMIDEPEISLHPQWLMLLVSVMRRTAERTNLIVATQSAELVRWLEPEELILADLEREGATFRRASDRKDLADWLKDFSLSELWTMGELGGRR